MKNYESLVTKIEERTEEFKENLRYNDFDRSLTDLMNQYLADHIQSVLESIMHDKWFLSVLCSIAGRRCLSFEGYRLVSVSVLNDQRILVSTPYFYNHVKMKKTLRKIVRDVGQIGLSAVDWFKQSAGEDAKIGVAGYCEGGLIAFCSAAVDKRIDAVFVSGYFNSRQRVWDEPIYRNVWALLTEFGDAEIASLVAPRSMVIEHSLIPDVVEKIEAFIKDPPMVNGIPFTGYKGRLKTPGFKTVQAESKRIDELTKPGFQQRYLGSGQSNKPVRFGSETALRKFALFLGQKSSMPVSGEIPADTRSPFDPEERQIRQVKEMEDHVQWLLRDSDYERNKRFLYQVMPEFGQRSWSTKPYHPYYSPERFVEKGKEYRKYFQEEILGKIDDIMLPPNARTPQIMVEGNSTAYNDVAARLADQGFITYAPHNLYRGEDRYRWLDRKANNVKKTLFSFIISQHDQLLQWLGTLPFVDKSRIAFYGLSYGGETAMRVPSVLEDYSLSICSGDFGDWTRVIVDTHHPGFMDSFEWEMPYFNMGSTFSYAEMVYHLANLLK